MRYLIILAALGIIIVGCKADTVSIGCEDGVEEICDGVVDSSSMVTVGASEFMMGCDELVNNCYEDETPYHVVDVPEFEIYRTEVTIGQYRACVDDDTSCSNPSVYSPYCNWRYYDREDHPVNCVDWYQARTYCEWDGKRLCTESEWEKAARGTDGRMYPWGDEEPDCNRVIMYENDGVCGEERTWPVSSKPAGVYGLYDMSGNVWEWVEDDFHGNYLGAPVDGSAWIDSPRANYRVVRGGGGTDSDVLSLRSFVRGDMADPYGVNYILGIRCCR